VSKIRNGPARDRCGPQRASTPHGENPWRAGAPLQWDVAAYVRMLGRPSIVRDTDALDLPAGKTSALLYYLAYRRDWVDRDTLLGLLYPESDERRARQSLRSLIAYVRRRDLARTIDVEPTRLRWRVASDVTAFLEALSEDRRAAAVEGYGGPFLAGFALPGTNALQGWIESVRAELARGWRDAAVGLASDLCAEKRYGEAARLLAEVLEADPLDEGALRLRLAALAQDGHRSAALAAYRGFAAMLAHELEVEPEEATARLAELITNDETDAIRLAAREETAEVGGEAPTAAGRRARWPRRLGPSDARPTWQAWTTSCDAAS